MANPAQAKLIVVLAALLILMIYLIEFKGVLDNQVGQLRELSGRISDCPGIEDIDRTFTVKGRQVFLAIENDGGVGPFRYKRPRAASEKVARLCREKATVAITYRTWKPQLRKELRYTLVALRDVASQQDVFTAEEYFAWNKSNRMWAYGLLAFLGFCLLYGLAVLVIPQWTVRDRRLMLEGDVRGGELLVKSSQRRGEAWVFLALFVALSIYFGSGYLREQRLLLLLLSVVWSVAAYAYLVEIVNTNRLKLESGCLVYRQGPLPWFGGTKRIPVDRIHSLRGEQQTQVSRHGPYTLYSVVLTTVAGEEETLFFTNSLAEAQAVAELVEEQLLAEKA